MSKYGQMLIPTYFPPTAHYLVRLFINLAGVELPAEDIHGIFLSSVAIQGNEELKNDWFTRFQSWSNTIRATVQLNSSG